MDIESVIKPKIPKGDEWLFKGPAQTVNDLGYEAYYWIYPAQNIAVISALEVVSDPNDIDKGPEYHISISKAGGRCTRNEARFVCKAFGMLDSEEDNHVPGGFVRNFWMPVAENLIGKECYCKTEEPKMVEDKGDFVWRGITG